MPPISFKEVTPELLEEYRETHEESLNELSSIDVHDLIYYMVTNSRSCGPNLLAGVFHSGEPNLEDILYVFEYEINEIPLFYTLLSDFINKDSVILKSVNTVIGNHPGMASIKGTLGFTEEQLNEPTNEYQIGELMDFGDKELREPLFDLIYIMEFTVDVICRHEAEAHFLIEDLVDNRHLTMDTIIDFYETNVKDPLAFYLDVSIYINRIPESLRQVNEILLRHNIQRQ